jgi:hypothetical protein
MKDEFKSITSLLTFIISKTLEDPLKVVEKLLEIIIRIPTTTAEAERNFHIKINQNISGRFSGSRLSNSYPSATRRHGNFAGVHTLLRILLSSNSAVLINIITGVSPPHFDFVVYYVLCQC